MLKPRMLKAATGAADISAAGMVQITINGVEVRVREGTSVAAAVAGCGEPSVTGAGLGATRISVTGQPRGPLCGMGICFECRAVINHQIHQRSCQIPCADGMEILTR